MTPQARLKEIEAQHLKWAYKYVAQEENTEWLINRVKELEAENKSLQDKLDNYTENREKEFYNATKKQGW